MISKKIAAFQDLNCEKVQTTQPLSSLRRCVTLAATRLPNSKRLSTSAIDEEPHIESEVGLDPYSTLASRFHSSTKLDPSTRLRKQNTQSEDKLVR
jgi:hypothetical protein